MKWTARPSATAPSIASASTGFSKSEPSSIGEVDARELLVDDAPGADVEVPDLGVAHLSLGQPDRQPGARRASCTGTSAKSASRFGVLAGATALPGHGRGHAEAVHDDEQRGQVLASLGVVPAAA